MSDWLTDSPRGEHLPIDCAYRFSYGKARCEAADLPAGWTIEMLPSDDERIQAFPCAHLPALVVDGIPVGFAFLLNPAGQVVATWDEGRWWTPEESEAWLLMLKVPSAYTFAEGLREAQMPRWWRRRKRK